MAGNRRKLGVVGRTKQTAVAARDVVVRWWKPVVAVVAISAAGFGAVRTVEHLSRTGRFVLRHVEVFGNERLDVSDIEEICGIETGVTNVFTAVPAEIALTCQDDDRVQWAAVSRIFPDCIRIRVREAHPAIFAAASDGLRAFDGMGKRHFKVNVDWDPGLPMLTGLESLMEPVEIPAPPYETEAQKRDRLEQQTAAEARNAARVSKVVTDAVRLLSCMDVAHSSWLDGGALLEFSDALGFVLRVPGRPALAVGFPPFEPRLAHLDATLTAIEMQNLQVEEVFIDNEKEPNLVSARWVKPDEGVAVTHAVTLE